MPTDRLDSRQAPPEEGAPGQAPPEEGALEEGAPGQAPPDEGALEEGAPGQLPPDEGALEEGAPGQLPPEEEAPNRRWPKGVLAVSPKSAARVGCGSSPVRLSLAVETMPRR